MTRDAAGFHVPRAKRSTPGIIEAVSPAEARRTKARRSPGAVPITGVSDPARSDGGARTAIRAPSTPILPSRTDEGATESKYLNAAQIPLAYAWFEIASICIALGIVFAATPWIAMLLLASGDFYNVGLDKILVASLGTLPFSIPLAFLVSRWVWRVAVGAFPRPKIRWPRWSASVAVPPAVPPGALLGSEVGQ